MDSKGKGKAKKQTDETNKKYMAQYRQQVRDDPEKYEEYLKYHRERRKRIQNDPELRAKHHEFAKKSRERDKERMKNDPEYKRQKLGYYNNWQKRNLQKLKEDPEKFNEYRKNKNEVHNKWNAKRREEGTSFWQQVKADPEAHETEKQKNRERVKNREKERGISVWEKIKQDPEKLKKTQNSASARYEKNKKDPEFLKNRRQTWHTNQENWKCIPVCPTCNMKHGSRDYDECISCRKGKFLIKRQEAEVHALLRENEMFPSLCDVKGPCATPNNNRRPDFVFSSADLTHTVILEVDEDYHRSWTPECENTRLGEVQDQFPEKPIFFIRYHPIRRKGKSSYTTITAQSKKDLIYTLKMVFGLPSPKEDELPCGYDICFIGYPDDRIEELTSTRERMQHDKMKTLMEEKKREDKLKMNNRRLQKFRNK